MSGRRATVRQMLPRPRPTSAPAPPRDVHVVRRAADGWDTDETYVVQVPSSVSLNAAAASVHPQPAAPAIIDHHHAAHHPAHYPPSSIHPHTMAGSAAHGLRTMQQYHPQHHAHSHAPLPVPMPWEVSPLHAWSPLPAPAPVLQSMLLKQQPVVEAAQKPSVSPTREAAPSYVTPADESTKENIAAVPTSRWDVADKAKGSHEAELLESVEKLTAAVAALTAEKAGLEAERSTLEEQLDAAHREAEEAVARSVEAAAHAAEASKVAEELREELTSLKATLEERERSSPSAPPAASEAAAGDAPVQADDRAEGEEETKALLHAELLRDVAQAPVDGDSEDSIDKLANEMRTLTDEAAMRALAGQMLSEAMSAAKPPAPST